MTKYEIVITLFTIIYGLMLADLFFSFHKLVRSRRVVKWHWLPVVSAWYLFVVILKNWWDLASLQGMADAMNIYFFVAYGHLLFVIFLLVSTALPDSVPVGGVNLKTYYFDNHRYFWGLMSLVVVISLMIAFVQQIGNQGPTNLVNLVAVCLFLALLLTLSLCRRYWVHAVLLVVLVLGIVFEMLNK